MQGKEKTHKENLNSRIKTVTVSGTCEGLNASKCSLWASQGRPRECFKICPRALLGFMYEKSLNITCVVVHLGKFLRIAIKLEVIYYGQ